jgi:DNA repair protein RadC
LKHTQLKITFDHKILSPPICCPEDTFDYLMKIWDKRLIGVQEQVNILYLDGANQVISWRCFNTGNGSETLFDLRLVMSCALLCLANKIIIGHNHPNCVLKPSRSDILITDRLKSACELLGINLEEHLIVCGKGNFYSFANNGLLR